MLQDYILRIRIAVHIAATALVTNQAATNDLAINNPFVFFSNLILQPHSLAESYFPSMPEDNMVSIYLILYIILYIIIYLIIYIFSDYLSNYLIINLIL
jgi:hypothetical protein